MREGKPIRVRGITNKDNAREAIRIAAMFQGIHKFHVYINNERVIVSECPNRVEDYDVIEIVEIWGSE